MHLVSNREHVAETYVQTACPLHVQAHSTIQVGISGIGTNRPVE